MTTENTAAAGGTGTAAPATPTTAPSEKQPLGFQNMTGEQFSARLAEERAAGAKGALRDLGVDSLDAAKARIAKAKDLETAQMSELEKATARAKELEPQAARAKQLETTLASILALEEAAVPDAKRGLLELAPAEPHARLEWIAKAKSQGLFAEPAAVETEKTKAANTRAGGTAPTAGGPPAKKHPRDMTADERRAAKAQGEADLRARNGS